MFGSVASSLSCAPRNLFRRYDENQLKVTAELLRAKGSEPVIEPASLLVSDWSQEDYLVMHLHRVGTALRPIAARPAEIPPAGEPQDPRTLRATSSTRNGITPSPPECRPEAFIASSLLIMGSNETPLLGKPVLPTSSCFLVRLTGGRFFVPA